MTGYVYLTTNDVNNKIYVGKRQKPRFEKWYKGSGTHLKCAFKKYGRDKFHTRVLEWCKTEEALCEAEKKWIAFYRGMGIEMYNIAEGGKGGNMVEWSELSPEWRAEINKKNSISHIGKKNGFYGKHHSEAMKEHLRETSLRYAYKDLPRPLIIRQRKHRQKMPKVAQCDKKTGELIKVWDNWCEASRAVSPNNRTGYSHIGECCRGERKSAYGYGWRLAEEGET